MHLLRNSSLLSSFRHPDQKGGEPAASLITSAKVSQSGMGALSESFWEKDNPLL
jgi:hypothetical protein